MLRLIGLGLGTAEIAAKLRRSVKTIESHRAQSSAELARYAIRWVENQTEQTTKGD